jgi:hypothetical protein
MARHRAGRGLSVRILIVNAGSNGVRLHLLGDCDETIGARLAVGVHEAAPTIRALSAFER